MPPRTKDWLLAKAASEGISPQEAAIRVLDRRAEKGGFPTGVRATGEEMDSGHAIAHTTSSMSDRVDSDEGESRGWPVFKEAEHAAISHATDPGDPGLD